MRRCKVVYSYQENNNDELSLGVGDIIEVLGEVSPFICYSPVFINFIILNLLRLKKAGGEEN